MPRYKPVDRSPRFLPVVLEEQIQPGTFEFALDHLVDNELDLSGLDAKFRNDETGATAYDPRGMLKIVLLGYSRGLISSRSIERACRDNVVFMAISGDQAPAYTSIARFMRELGPEIHPLFTQVLLVCDEIGLIGREMFAIDEVKLPSNASKERSGTHAELAHKAQRYEKATQKILEAHREQDEGKAEPTLATRLRRQGMGLVTSGSWWHNRAMKIAIELNQSQAERLQTIAASLGVDVQELAQAAVADLVSAGADDFEAAASRVLLKNRELYRRLA
ncbi:MAG: transposase [Betaproteobacteria bacterium]|nr:transposase [Betaproteobacteria bacterium]